MALIGFTVFKEKILDGSKRQTIRVPRKRPIKWGESLYLYWHLRRKDCQLLRIAHCNAVFNMRWADMKNNLELALKDGFKGLDDFRAWFARYNPNDDTIFTIIRW